MVPAASALRNIQPKSFTRTLYPEDNVYEVAWIPPKDKASIVSYTIFWCKYEKDRPHYCEGFLDWEEVPMLDRSAETLIHNITLPDGGNYQMAIAANTETVSSGPFISDSSSLENNFPFFLLGPDFPGIIHQSALFRDFGSGVLNLVYLQALFGPPAPSSKTGWSANSRRFPWTVWARPPPLSGWDFVQWQRFNI